MLRRMKTENLQHTLFFPNHFQIELKKAKTFQFLH